MLIELLGEPKDAQRLLCQWGFLVMSAMLFVLVLGLLPPPVDGGGRCLGFEDRVLNVGSQLPEKTQGKVGR